MAQRSSPALVNQWFANPSKDLLSGLVVAFAMIPEAIAFSGIAGVDPKVGLFGAFCLSLTICRGGWSHGDDHLRHRFNGPADDGTGRHR